jgi:hypothetical protein
MADYHDDMYEYEGDGDGWGDEHAGDREHEHGGRGACEEEADGYNAGGGEMGGYGGGGGGARGARGGRGGAGGRGRAGGARAGRGGGARGRTLKPTSCEMAPKPRPCAIPAATRARTCVACCRPFHLGAPVIGSYQSGGR